MTRKQNGFTLIELMIGMIVGLIVLSAVVYIFLVTLRTSKDVLNSARLNEEVSVLTDILVGEIRRAGYWYIDPSTVSGAVVSPYAGGAVDDLYISPSGDCILLSYDIDESGAITGIDYRGFKLDSEAILYRSESSTANMSSCSASDSWLPITVASAIAVSSLSFSDISSGSGCSALSYDVACGTGPHVQTRTIEFLMTVSSARDSTLSTKISERVKIRNNRVFE